MDSSVISNPPMNPERSRASRRRKRKIQIQNTTNPKNTWNTKESEKSYSYNLLKAISRVRCSNGGACRGQAVHEAADRALAYTAKGRTRWSRAVLSSRIKLKFMKRKRNRAIANRKRCSNKVGRVRVLRFKNIGGVNRKARVLGRLIPGCRKESLPVLLEETADYIAAKQMQIKAMKATFEKLKLLCTARIQGVD